MLCSLTTTSMFISGGLTMVRVTKTRVTKTRAIKTTAVRGSALGAAVALLAAGCATTAPAAAAGASGSGTKITVVVAENFWGSIAAQLGGDHVTETSIIDNPDTDPHSYEPTSADARTIAGAQLFIQ